MTGKISLRVRVSRPIYCALLALVEVARAGEDKRAGGRVTAAQQAAEYAENSIVERFEKVFAMRVGDLAKKLEGCATTDARAAVIGDLVRGALDSAAPGPSVEDEVAAEFRGLSMMPARANGAGFRRLLAR